MRSTLIIFNDYHVLVARLDSNRFCVSGPPLAGVVVDVMADTGLALDMSGLLLLLSTILCLAAIFRYQFTRRRDQYQQLA